MKQSSKHKITLQFTLEELQVLVTLAENQLFRVKFIDPRMGHKASVNELQIAQSAIDILETALKKEKGLSRGSVVLSATKN